MMKIQVSLIQIYVMYGVFSDRNYAICSLRRKVGKLFGTFITYRKARKNTGMYEEEAFIFSN